MHFIVHTRNFHEKKNSIGEKNENLETLLHSTVRTYDRKNAETLPA